MLIMMKKFLPRKLTDVIYTSLLSYVVGAQTLCASKQIEFHKLCLCVMSNTIRFFLFFVMLIALNVILFYTGLFIFLKNRYWEWLGKLADDQAEQAFYALAFPIAGIVVFDAVALLLFSKYSLKEE